MKNYKKILLTLIFFPILAYSKSIPLSDQKTNSISVSTNLKSQTDSIIAVTFKLLYENQVKANDAVLQTIFYALGGLGAAMIFVFASNWWFNEKKVEEIKKGINSQISSEISKKQSDLQKEINTGTTNLTLKFNEFKDKIGSEIKDDNKTLLENYQTQLKSFSENINIQLSTLRTSIDERIDFLQKNQDTNIQNTKSSIDRLKHKIEISSKRLQKDALNNEASLWLIKGVPLNAFRCFIAEGVCSIEINYEWNLKYVFIELEKALKDIQTVRQSDVDAFNDFIKLVPKDSYVVEKTNLTEIFNKKPVKELSL